MPGTWIGKYTDVETQADTRACIRTGTDMCAYTHLYRDMCWTHLRSLVVEKIYFPL